jgi:uncharacterized RDD family membrane protein YckC
VSYSLGPSAAEPVAGAFSSAGASVASSAPRQRNFAGFWLRLVAAFIDGLVLLLPIALLGALLFAGTLPRIMRDRGNRALLVATIVPHVLTFLLLIIAGTWLYWALLESSSWQATLGKRALGLYVTDLEGRRATFGKASGRFFAGRGLGSIPYLGGLYFLIDCICAGVTDRKQAIHDMIAGCLVMRRS